MTKKQGKSGAVAKRPAARKPKAPKPNGSKKVKLDELQIVKLELATVKLGKAKGELAAAQQAMQAAQQAAQQAQAAVASAQKEAKEITEQIVKKHAPGYKLMGIDGDDQAVFEKA
jgi:Xaa-Pro aminopeptidase